MPLAEAEFILNIASAGHPKQMLDARPFNARLGVGVMSVLLTSGRSSDLSDHSSQGI